MSGIEDPELTEIEQRAGRAFAIAPTPWTPLLETRHVIGGESFIRLGNDPNLDQELYVSLHIGSAATAAVVRLLADRSCPRPGPESAAERRFMLRPQPAPLAVRRAERAAAAASWPWCGMPASW
jgi:hypothetical protein